MIQVTKNNRSVRTALMPLVAITGATDQAASVSGRILLQAVDIPSRSQLKGLTISNGTTVAGGATVGVYGPIATPFSPNSEALVATSADTVLTGSLVPQTIPFTTTPTVQPGQYYVAVEFSNTTHQYRVALGSSASIASSRGRVDQTYGALPSTLPAFTNSSLGHVICLLEVAPIP